MALTSRGRVSQLSVQGGPDEFPPPLSLEAKLEAQFGALPADRAGLHRTSIVSGTPKDLIG